jgi:hypothetical protein
MDALKNEWLNVLMFMVGNPGSVLEGVVSGALALMAFAFVLHLVGDIFGCSMTGTERCLGVLAITVLSSSIGGVIGSLYIAPLVDSHAIQTAAPWVMAGILALAAVVPLACFLLKGKYGQTLASLLISAAAFALIVSMVHAGFNMARASGQSIDKARQQEAQRMQRIQ